MKIGILGGACFWKTWNLPFEQIDVNTPYGKPSDFLCKGYINEHEVYTLQRHGKNYELSPENIPYEANAFALALQKIDFVIEVTSSGSLRDSDHAGEIIVFDQLIDYTRKRPDSLFAPVIEKYTNVNFAQPVSRILSNFAHALFSKHDIKHHFGGTLLTEDGPRFSTLSESRMYRLMGADFVNQTSCPSLYFLRELGIPVLGLTMITNLIDLTQEGEILTEEVSESIKKYGHNMSKCIHLLISSIKKTIELEKYTNKNYDVTEFELRT